MIIPIRCFTCNTILAGRWELYQKKLHEYRREAGITKPVYLTKITQETPEFKAMNDINIIKPCCRRHFLSHVDLL